MAEWLISLEGTDQGHRLAVMLALSAAVLHALFGALQKGRHDPYLSRGAIDIAAGLMAAPVALFVVPWPEPHMWLIFAGVFIIHVGYKLALAETYKRGAYTVVYPVVRGTAPLVVVLASGLVFGERYNGLQWLGIAILVGGIFGLAAYNLRHVTIDRDRLVPALLLAMLTGCFVALYTTYDAYGIRSTADPFTFIAWFFFIDSFFMPLVVGRRWRTLPASDLIPLVRLGVIGALVAFASFGSIMLATRLSDVGQAAVLRETSSVFAALIGWLMLGEKVGPRRTALMAMIAGGAILVELARAA